MIYNARELARVRDPVLLLSAMTWILLVVEPGGVGMFAHCPATKSGMPVPASLQMVLAMWSLMLVAMMSPVLIQPIRHIRLCSFTHRRERSITLFVTGYAAIWMALGGVLLSIDLAAKSSPQSYLVAEGVALIALVWQFSPIKQRCLNRCHAHAELAAFGVAADFDALRFGVTHGVWCAGSCWALMLFPMVLPRGHVLAMAAVAILIFGEKLEAPTPPSWRRRGPGRAARFVVAQARIRLRRLASAAIPPSNQVEDMKSRAPEAPRLQRELSRDSKRSASRKDELHDREGSKPSTGAWRLQCCGGYKTLALWLKGVFIGAIKRCRSYFARRSF